MTEKIRCATAMVKALEAVGVEFAFAYNGHGNWALLDAIEYESDIRGIACRGEDQAVHLADGYYRAGSKRAIPVVSTSVGPGNMNIASALSNAFFESSAMLVLAGAGSTHWQDRGGIEEYYRYAPDEWIQTVKTYTKKAAVISRPDTAVEMVLRGYKTAITGRPGPVVLQVPFDIQHSLVAPDDLSAAKQLATICPPGPDQGGIKEAAGLIARAERPLVFVSGGVHRAAAHALLTTLVEEFGLPIATTSMGKGAYPEDRPLSLGVAGRSGTGHANRAAGACDLLIAIGTHFSDIDTGGWTLFNIPDKTKLIHIDIDPSEIARVYPTEVGLWSDAGLALMSLVEELRSVGVKPSRFAPWHQQLGQWRSEWLQTVAELLQSKKLPMSYATVCDTVGGVINARYPDASVFVDTGHLLSFAPAFLKTLKPNFNHCGFFHRMGWSLPAALGAKFARPEQPAIALLGDGSFIFANSALATCFEYGMPVTAIVMNNKSLQIERELMRRIYGRSAFVDYAVEKTGEPWNPDFLKIAEAMGARSWKVTKAEELAPAVTQAVDSGVASVIDVDIDVEAPGYRSVWYPYPNNFWTAKTDIPKHL